MNEHAQAAEELVELARGIATEAHDGQIDKAGRRYIDHPQRVAERAAIIAGPDLAARAAAAAWLHDVVEDTEVSLDELGRRGIPAEVCHSVDLLTKREGLAVEDYFGAIRSDKIARIVKLADVIDNTSPERVRELDEATRERLGVKYARSFELLLGVGDE